MRESSDTVSRPVTLSWKPSSWNSFEETLSRVPSSTSMSSDMLMCQGSIPKSPKLPAYTVATSCSAVALNPRTVLSE